jgi:SAM-dependent methyltransferase
VNDIIRQTVRDYYGETLASKADLQTGACCSSAAMSLAHQAILANIHPEILDRFYGCGSPIPDAIEGSTVLDLGCGTGRDVFLCSALVGEAGRVVGVDMTPEQLAIGRKHQEPQARAFGHRASNVTFLDGPFEELNALGIADASVDVVISNCALNLASNKRAVFAEIYRVLKPGGELLFSDVFASRRLPEAVARDPLLIGECLGGALYGEDFRRLMRDVGWPSYFTIKRRPIAIAHPYVAHLVGPTAFWSMTVRAMKVWRLEDVCEDYGQVATYLGTIADLPHWFDLDDDHRFIAGKPMLVCGNSAACLGEGRLRAHFRIDGDRTTHFGAFGHVFEHADAAKTGGCC